MRCDVSSGRQPNIMACARDFGSQAVGLFQAADRILLADCRGCRRLELPRAVSSEKGLDDQGVECIAQNPRWSSRDVQLGGNVLQVVFPGPDGGFPIQNCFENGAGNACESLTPHVPEPSAVPPSQAVGTPAHCHRNMHLPLPHRCSRCSSSSATTFSGWPFRSQ